MSERERKAREWRDDCFLVAVVGTLLGAAVAILALLGWGVLLSMQAILWGDLDAKIGGVVGLWGCVILFAYAVALALEHFTGEG